MGFRESGDVNVYVAISLPGNPLILQRRKLVSRKAEVPVHWGGTAMRSKHRFHKLLKLFLAKRFRSSLPYQDDNKTLSFEECY